MRGTAWVAAVVLASSPAAALGAKIPTRVLAGGGAMPMLGMGGSDFTGWFDLAGKGAMIQTFHGYGNGAQIAPQLAKVGRGNVFVSTGIPCGCCGSDAPKARPL